MRSPTLTLMRAKRLRRTMTKPEVMLWSLLRRRDEDTPVYRRQHPLGPYILDFYCPAAKLVVEIDGAQHSEEGQEAHDLRRDAWLRSQGLTVYRVQASSVFEDVVEVADGIRRRAAELMRAKRES